MKSLLNFIKEQCPDHDGVYTNYLKNKKIYNYCWRDYKDEEYTCGYFKENNNGFRCKHIEIMLPLDKELEAVYYAELEAKSRGVEISNTERKKIIKENTIKIKCKQCGDEFKGKGKLCNKCRKENQRGANKKNSKKSLKKNT